MSDYMMAIGTKVAAGVVLLGLPALVHPAWTVVVGGLLVVLATGFLMAMVFQVAHVVEEAEFGNSLAKVPYRWHEWQIRTSIDFSHGSSLAARALRWYVGGLDHQGEHHLFPRIPHTAYSLITPAIDSVCVAHGIERYVHPNYRSGVASHYRLLKKLGQRPSTGLI